MRQSQIAFRITYVPQLFVQNIQVFTKTKPKQKKLYILKNFAFSISNPTLHIKHTQNWKIK